VSAAAPTGLHWQQLEKVATVVMGQSPPSSAYNTVGEGLPFFQGKAEFGAFHPTAAKWCTAPTKIAQPGDVLMSIRAPVGPTNLATERCCIGRGLAAIRPGEGVRSKWLLYALRSIERSIDALGTGTTFKAISGETVRQLSVPVASLDHQDSVIAEIEKQFSRLHDAVDNLKRVKVNAERYKASVLNAAVEGRLVPSEAEVARREGRTYETGTQFLQRILETRRSQWKGKYKKPVSPEINGFSNPPEGWTWASLDQLTSKITSGSRDWSPFYGKGRSIFVLAQNVRPLTPDFSVRQFVDPPMSDSSRERSRIQVGDLLATIVGANTGQVCLIEGMPWDSYVCQSVALIRPALLGIATFINYWLNSDEHGKRYFGGCMYGQGRPHLSFEQLMATPIALPPIAEQTRIADEVDRRLSLATEIAVEIELNLNRASSTHQSILQQTFSCELRARRNSAGVQANT